jgi:alkylation response protein AidB-like acyl-CoA dehydrogenase
MGVICFALICHTGWALGIGRRLLDELVELVQSKAGRPGAQGDTDSFLEGLADAEGKVGAARAFAHEIWTDARDTLARGEKLSLRQHTLLRLGATHVTWAVHDAGMFVYLSGGTTALRSGTIQRLFRDLHAGSQHLIVSPFVKRGVGRELAGLGGEKTWRFVELVDA